MDKAGPRKRIRQHRAEIAMVMAMLMVVIAVGHYNNYEDVGGVKWAIGLVVRVGYTWAYFRLKDYFVCGAAMAGGLAMFTSRSAAGSPATTAPPAVNSSS